MRKMMLWAAIVGFLMGCSCRKDERATTGAVETSLARSTVPYALAPDGPRKNREDARSASERIAYLARRWELVKLAVGQVDTSGRAPFRSSVTMWQTGFVPGGKWGIDSRGNFREGPVAIEDASVWIRGDCLSDITITRGARLVHIYGDVGARVTVLGQCEVIIGGSVLKDATIRTDGIARIFLGGNLNGSIENKGSAMTWINGDCSGLLGTGSPLNVVHVMGSFGGTLRPLRPRAMLVLDIRGFMPLATLQKVRGDYIDVMAAIGTCDYAPGLHTMDDAQGEVRFVVHRQRK